MKKNLIQLVLKSALAFVFASVWTVSSGQTDKKDKQLVEDSKSGIKDFIHTDSLMKKRFKNDYGYVVFPNVGKGAVALVALRAVGIVYEKGVIVGKAQMTQVTIGLQFGGQAYREVIFFEDKATLDRFKENNSNSLHRFRRSRPKRVRPRMQNMPMVFLYSLSKRGINV
ncbi:MAG: hypothetical protein WDM78_01635 [Puia sp.]